MLITRFEPMREINELRRGFEYLNSIVNSLDDQSVESGISAFTPAVNSRETEDAYILEIDLPGVKKEDIEIDVKDNVLSISGERKIKEELKEDNYYKIESRYGKFVRSFTLPKNANIEKISAKSENGVLEIVIPKIEAVKKEPKKIEIK
jgi:HSP20 family protein